MKITNKLKYFMFILAAASGFISATPLVIAEDEISQNTGSPQSADNFEYVSAPAVSSANNLITGIRVGRKENGLRIVFDSTDEPKFKSRSLINPNRIVVSLPSSLVFIPSQVQQNMDKLIADFTYGTNDKETSKLVFKVYQPSKITNSFVLKPSKDNQLYRGIIDVDFLPIPIGIAVEVKNNKSKTQEQIRNNEQIVDLGSGVGYSAKTISAIINDALAKTPTQGNLNNILKDIPVIVIDPGHGGQDPGAQYHGEDQDHSHEHSLYEKTVTLRFSKMLALGLANTNKFKVYLTRNTDVYISLKDRAEFARKVGASAFISIHADASEKSDVSGATIYTISEKASDTLSEKIAESENQADLLAGYGINFKADSLNSSIIIDLAQREAINQSIVLAQHAIREISAVTPLNRRPHRHAGFRVLKTIDIPAVLIELGYMTNESDRENFSTDSWQSAVASALVRAIEEFHHKPYMPSDIGAGLADLDDTRILLSLMEGKAKSHSISDIASKDSASHTSASEKK